MLIRCPDCTFTRQVNEDKIPAGSEFATCPKCKSRFRFRTLPPEEKITREEAEIHTGDPDKHPQTAQTPARPAAESAPGPEQDRAEPDSSLAANRQAGDVWSAVENLNERWDKSRANKEPEERADQPPSGLSGPDQDGTDADIPDDFEAGRPQNSRLEADELEDESPHERPPEGSAELEDAGRRARQAYQGRHQTRDPQTERDERGRKSSLADSGSVPWEYKGGFLNPQAFVRTIILSFTRIPEFFGGIPARGSLLPATVFTLVLRAVQFAMAFMFLKLTVLTPEGETVTTTLAEMVHGSIPQIIITVLFIVLLMQFASAWVVNFMVKIVNQRASFSLTFKVVSYSLSPLVFTLIPHQIGMVCAEVGCLALFTLGLRHAYRLSWKKTMMVLIPLMALMFLINISGSVFMLAG